MHARPAIEKSGARLIAVAKERLGHEEFLNDHWNKQGGLADSWLRSRDAPLSTPPVTVSSLTPELYYDTWKEGELPGQNPLFRVTNGNSMKWTGVASYLFGGAVAKNNSRVDSKNIKGNYDGEGTILGSILVIDKHGEVLLHHQEQSWGDHPSDEALLAAVSRLGADQSSL